MISWCALALCVSAVLASNITVEQRILNLEEEYTLVVTPSIEFILQFVPNEDQAEFPSRLWVRSVGGDTSRPLLLTARTKTGATTWQLPYQSGSMLMSELERTLCWDGSPTDAVGAPSECEGAGSQRGFTLHLASACAAPLTVTLRAAPARDWLLGFQARTTVTATQTGPAVNYYDFIPGQNSVRLIVESEDEVCATISVQRYTCPLAETIEDIDLTTLRMTVMRSGAVQLSRSLYPMGFYVVSLVRPDDAACSGEPAPEDDWLLEEALWAHTDRPSPPATLRQKTFTLTVRASLSRAQYMVGAGVTVAVFLLFYAGFAALVLAQRWPACARLTAPRAVLADAHKSESGALSEGVSVTGVTAETGVTSVTGVTSDAGTPVRTARRRRGSDATFDSSDASDTDSEEESPAVTNDTITNNMIANPTASSSVPKPTTSPGTPGNQGAASPPDRANGAVTEGDAIERSTVQEETSRPFGLPARLHVAALARRGRRVLRARSDRYLHTLYTVAVFYALPVLQFVAAFQVMLNISGSLDMCYYNFLCAHPAGGLSDFNHVFSNLGYLLLGALFMLQLQRRKRNRKRAPRHEEYGIPAHYGLLSSLGAAMMVVALLSASYHVCPNSLNFQFDTAFMYVLAVLCMVKIYQSRHPDINARAHATFGVLAVFIALVVWGVLGGGPLFWSVFTVLHVFTFLLLSLRIYYVGQFRLEKSSLAVAARGLRARPLYTPRLVMLLIANAANWGFAIYGLLTQAGDIATHLLNVLLCNTLLYIVFYVLMKLLHGERIRWYSWCFLAAAAACWVPALYFFTSGSTDWSATPARSRHRNHECRVLQFYDSHDLWHMLSAAALYFTFNVMLTWDDGLSAVKRTEIAVF